MKLFEPGKIGKLLIKNRIIMAPMRNNLEELDGRLSQRSIDYFVARARGGAGLIITGAARVTREIEQLPRAPFVSDFMIDNVIYAGRLSELAEAVHDYGAKVAVQVITGLGRNSRLEILKSAGAVAPSRLPSLYDPSIMTREMTIEEIKRLVEAMKFAAETMRIAGIDAVELHAHGGCLLDQFMTTLWNKRTDRYGDDLDGRLRLACEIIEALKSGGGSDFPVIMKFALAHNIEGGREVKEGLEIVRRLEAAGVDAFEIDAGCKDAPFSIGPSSQPPGYMVELAEMTKNAVKVPVIGVGKLGYPELAEKVLEEGKVDFVSLGRPLLADPEWPNKVREGKLEDICTCVGCNEGCMGRIRAQKYVSCALNPVTGMERDFAIEPAKQRKSVVVIGGGPGGMEAARVAALRGHKVTLYEKGKTLGGNLTPASVPEFKKDYRSLVSYLSTQLSKLGVNVELGKEATPELLQEMKPDVVFLATGGMPIISMIPGIEKEKVFTAVDLLLGKSEVREPVVDIGGGVVGCETALYLAQKGKKLTIIEILDSVMRDIQPENSLHMMKLLREADVKILTETRVLEITDEGLLVADKDGKRSRLEAGTVVLAMGFKPRRGLVEALRRGKVSEVYAIGDCVEPRKVMNAIWEGFRTARLI